MVHQRRAPLDGVPLLAEALRDGHRAIADAEAAIKAAAVEEVTSRKPGHATAVVRWHGGNPLVDEEYNNCPGCQAREAAFIEWRRMMHDALREKFYVEEGAAARRAADVCGDPRLDGTASSVAVVAQLQTELLVAREDALRLRTVHTALNETVALLVKQNEALRRRLAVAQGGYTSPGKGDAGGPHGSIRSGGRTRAGTVSFARQHPVGVKGEGQQKFDSVVSLLDSGTEDTKQPASTSINIDDIHDRLRAVEQQRGDAKRRDQEEATQRQREREGLIEMKYKSAVDATAKLKVDVLHRDAEIQLLRERLVSANRALWDLTGLEGDF